MKLIITFIASVQVFISFGQQPELEMHWWQPDGPVHVVEYDSSTNQVFLGGEFNSVAPYVQYNAFLHTHEGIPDMRFPNVYGGNILTTCDDGNGGWFIGGTFTRVGDSLRNRIAHISSTGTILSTFSGKSFNGEVKKIARAGDTLIVAGKFNGYGETVRDYILLDLSTLEVNPVFPFINGPVSALEADGMGGWFISGSFTQVGDSLRTRLAHVDANFTVSSWAPTLDVWCSDMVLTGDTLIITGPFNTVNGQPKENLAAIHKQTGALLNWNPSINAYATAMAIHDNKLYMIGDFTLVNGVGPPYFSAIDLNTAANVNLPYLSNYPFPYQSGALEISGDTAYIGGYFYNFGGMPSRNIAAFDLTNQTVLNWFPTGVDSTVTSITCTGTKVALGGHFYGVTFVNKSNGFVTGNTSLIYTIYQLLAKGDTVYAGTTSFGPGSTIVPINANTHGILPLEIPVTGTAILMGIQNNNLLAVGNMQGISGAKRHRLAQLSVSTSEALPVVMPRAGNDVNDLVIDGNQFFLAGRFGTLGDSLRYLAGAVNRFTGMVTSWKPQPFLNSSAINNLVLDGNTLFASGSFQYSLNGVTRKNVAAFDKSTGVVYSWSPSVNNSVYSMGISDDLVFIGGDFDSIAGISREFVAAFHKMNGALANLDLHVNSYVLGLSIQQNLLYLSGDFDSINGHARNGIAAYDFLSQQPTSWNPDPDGIYMYSVFAYPSKAIVSGPFSKIGRKYRKNLLALDFSSGMPTDLNIQPDGKVTSLARYNDRLFIGGEFNQVNGLPRVSIAEINLDSGSVTAFDAGMNSMYEIEALHVSGDNLYAGGWFSTFMGQPRQRLASYNLVSGVLNPLALPVFNSILDIASKGDTLFLGGSFFINNTPVGNLNNLCGYNTVTDSYINLNANTQNTDWVHSVLPSGDSVYVGGDFDMIGGQPRGNLAVFNLATGNVGAWNPDTTGSPYVNAIETYDSLLFVGGTFLNFQYPVGYGKFAVVDKESGMLAAWKPKISGNVYDLEMYKSRLFIGGNISHAFSTGISPIQELVVFNLSPGPAITPLVDVITCATDTIGPIAVTIYDSLDVNTVVLTASSSNNALIPQNQIFISGSGSTRFITLVPASGAAGVTTIYLVATNQQGGTDYTSFNITIGGSIVQITGDTILCSGDSAILNAGTSYASYLWNTGSVTPYITVTTSGIYSVQATDYNGCTSTGSVLVTVNPLPSVSVLASTSPDICSGDSVLLYAPPGLATYQWLRNNVPVVGANTVSLYVTNPGNYRCSVSDTNSCYGVSNAIRVRIVCIPLGPNHEKSYISSEEIDEAISIIPNPSQGDFMVYFNCTGTEPVHVTVYDEVHRIIRSERVQDHSGEYVISKLPAGVYLVGINCNNKALFKKVVQLK